MTSVQRLQKEQEEEHQKREKMLRSRKRLVERLKNDKSEVQKSIARLEEDAKEIAGILEELESQGRLAEEDSSLVGLADSKGDLIWPVQGRIFRKFGTTKDKRGIVLSNPGIDIQAKLGTDVQAAAPGTIIYTSWLRGYGQFIIIDHGKGYYTLYANLSDILVEVGDHIKGGELIALVGDSGSLEGPKLHFEVRHRKEQLDPMDWLR
jgi:septal ring factor EnvC (AmiA/AmiB activator)